MSYELIWCLQNCLAELAHHCFVPLLFLKEQKHFSLSKLKRLNFKLSSSSLYFHCGTLFALCAMTSGIYYSTWFLCFSSVVQPGCYISFLMASFFLLSCVICVWKVPAIEISHSFSLETLPYLNSHCPEQLTLCGEELEMILNNATACLAKDLQSRIFI